MTHPIFDNPNPAQREVMDKIDELKAKGKSRDEIELAIYGEGLGWDEPQQQFGYSYFDWLFHDEEDGEDYFSKEEERENEIGVVEREFDVSFSPAAEKHMRAYLDALHAASAANARTMKLMSRTIYQQVILRETGLTRRPKSHQVQLSDIDMFKWNRKKGKIGY